MDPNQDDKQSLPSDEGQNQGGSVPQDQPASQPADQPVTQENCHCGKPVSGGMCTGCNQATGTCICQPEEGQSGPSMGGSEPQGTPPAV